MGAKLTGGHRQPGVPQPLDKLLVKLFRLLRFGGRRERGTVAFARIAVQSELRHHQDLAARVCDRAIHLSIGVREDAQGRDFFREAFHLRGSVLFADAEQDAKPAADRSDGPRVNADPGLTDSLNDQTHKWFR